MYEKMRKRERFSLSSRARGLRRRAELSLRAGNYTRRVMSEFSLLCVLAGGGFFFTGVGGRLECADCGVRGGGNFWE